MTKTLTAVLVTGIVVAVEISLPDEVHTLLFGIADDVADLATAVCVAYFTKS